MTRFATARRAVGAALLLSALFVGACSAPAPYVYRDNEFSRTSPNFGKDPTDIKYVVICYGRMGTKPEQVVALAREECGRFGKVPQLYRQSLSLCPLATPVAADFDCVVPAAPAK